MLLFLAASLVFFADWLSKFYIKENLSVGESIPVIKDFFYLTYLKNKGVIFGLFFPHPILVTILSGVVVLALAIFSGKISRKNHWFKINLGLLWGGLLGNFFDRLWDRDVIDFLDFRLWPVFNLADMAMCIGAGLLVIGAVRHYYGSRPDLSG